MNKFKHLISINLPTIRPELAKVTIDSLNGYSCPFNYEIVVCSPEKIVGDNVRWIKDPPTIAWKNLLKNDFLEGRIK